jgi:hypothetical protein
MEQRRLVCFRQEETKALRWGKANFFEVLEIEDLLHKQLINRDFVEKILL